MSERAVVLIGSPFFFYLYSISYIPRKDILIPDSPRINHGCQTSVPSVSPLDISRYDVGE